jgi:hypothetical protein
MLAIEAPRRARSPRKLVGHANPRIAPPVPARHELDAFRTTASGMGIELMPWQEVAARYLTAKGKNGLLYREVCIVVARQNGKTTLMKPHIIRALRTGKKVTHIAQTRELPRQMFEIIADALSNEPGLFPTRRGRTIWPRFGAGQEEIKLLNGGSYRIAAANRGGGRGWSNDIVIVDELREMKDYLVIGAAEPTLTMSPDPQMIYLSNAGADDSVVLNEVRARADTDPSLAYLEWSAAPERAPDDREGWAEANPALGHYPQVLRTLEDVFGKGRTALFETEHLCRWVAADEERVVSEADWLDRRGTIGKPEQPYMAISLDPTGRRASAAVAWQAGDQLHVRIEADVTGSPIDLDRLGKALKERAATLGIRETGYDDWTDKDLARWFHRSRHIGGHEFSAACDKFDRIVRGGGLVWDAADQVTEDLRWLTRKPHESGAWQASRVSDEHSVTAALATIRAVWMASLPQKRATSFLA